MGVKKQEGFEVWDLDDREVDDIIDEDEEVERSGPRKRSAPKDGTNPGRRSTARPRGKVPSQTGKGPVKGAGETKRMGVLKSKPLIWSMRIAVVVSVLVLLFLPLHPLEQFREDAGLNKLRNLLRPFKEFPEWVEVEMGVDYDLNIVPPHPGSQLRADEVRIKTAVPFDIMDANGTFRVQDVMNVSMEPAATDPLPDFNEEKNRISGWTLRNVKGDFSFSARFTLKLYSYQWKIDREDSGTVSDIPQSYKDRYLDDEWIVNDRSSPDPQPIDEDEDGQPDFYRYHPSAPQVRTAAERVTSGETTVYGKVRAIYEWMEEHFNYTSNDQRQRDQERYGSWPKYPLGTLSDWYGDCDDQSLLMASMCRAVGIPAWLEIGYLYDPVHDTWGGHGWFNVVIPSKNSGIVVAPIDPVNHEFLFRDPYRITDWIDTGSMIRDEDGELVFNLDHYYNYFKVEKPSDVTVSTPDVDTRSIVFKDHGRIRQYVDQRLEPGSLPGSQSGYDQLPFPGISLAAAALVPVLLGRKRLR